MQYSISMKVTIQRTLALLAIMAVVFGPFSTVFAVSNEVPPVVVDVCSNIEGAQLSIPEGMSATEGICTQMEVPVVDMCSNIEGTQLEIPNGLVANEGMCTENVTPAPISGCMDDGALNYNSSATIGDDSCRYENDDDSEEGSPDPVLGCMDDEASNYNSQATESDKSCVYSQCEAGANLLVNGSFETPTVTNEQGWDVFDSIVNGLVWAVSWINPSESSPAIAKLELQNGRPASAGEQYAELDSNFTHPGEAQILGDARVKIAQTITTVPGAVYTLTYDFSAVPGHGHEMNNKVQVMINGTVVDTQTTSLPRGARLPVWTHRAFTFTATGTTTEVALADAGRSSTFGTLIDNVSLTTCVVPPVEVKTCTINVVSDVTNTVAESEDAPAVLTWVHPAWLAAIPSSTAKWIWSSATVQNPSQEETKTFVKTFTWNGPATAALLQIAADNSYSVTLNGSPVAADTAEANYAVTDAVNVAAQIVTGENTLEITVKNWTGGEGATAESNPAGVLYDLTVTGDTKTDCTRVPDGDDGDDGDNDRDTYRLFGTVWNDVDTDNTIDEGESDLSGWTVRAVNASNSEAVYTDVTDVDGLYEINVPAGTWIISQLTTSGWVLLSPGDSVNGIGTYTVTVPAPVEFTFMNWLIPTAQAATLASFGAYNFGNIVATTTTPDTTVIRHGRNSSSNNNNSNDGQVLGDSITTAAPAGEVLGASTSTLPVGAPNTGAGGTASLVEISTINAILAARVTARKAK